MQRALSTSSQNEEFCDILCYIFLVLVVNPGLPAKNTRFRVPRRKYWALGFHYKAVDSITIILASRDPPPPFGNAFIQGLLLFHPLLLLVSSGRKDVGFKIFHCSNIKPYGTREIDPVSKIRQPWNWKLLESWFIHQTIMWMRVIFIH